MPHIAVNGLELYYETDGDPENAPILLIAGLGVQMIDWPPYLIDGLIEAGLYVVRFDNRDIGFSTTFEDAPGDPQVVMEAVLTGEEPDVGYRLSDMAADAAGLLDALDLAPAHVLGVSMGGMIAQVVAINHPDKMRSLTSIMSSTGEHDVGQPTPEAMAAITSPATSQERDEVVAHNIKNAKVWASPDHLDIDRLQRLFENAWDRVEGKQALNAGRQFCAILASGERSQGLAGVTAPALVVHGTADTLIAMSGGERTAACLPNAEVLLIEGMGHDLMPAFVPGIVDAISELVSRTAVASA